MGELQGLKIWAEIRDYLRGRVLWAHRCVFYEEKSEAIDKFKEYCRDMRRVPDEKRVRILRSDGAGGTEAENTYATEFGRLF